MSQIALITGAGRGIGAATAKLLGERGYAVCVNYRSDADSAETVVRAIAASGGQAFACEADVAEPAAVEALFAAVDERFGPLDALVNNAGIFGPRSRFESLSMDDAAAVFATNVLGLMHCTQQAARRMSTAKGGRGGAIVNVSSGSAVRGNANSGVHYATSKGAVNSFTIGISQELAPEGIRVNAVAPGLTRTDMPDEARLEREGPTIPMGRVGEPGEIAETIAWLLSPAASYVAGANIRVAGGRP